MGNVIKEIDTSAYEKMVDKLNKAVEEEERHAEALADSPSFQLVYAAKKYDDWFLDPIVGLVIPGFGDILSSIAILPALYVSTVKLQSIRLTIAILYVSILDILCGIIPGAGDLVDAFYKSNKIACRLIVGYVEDDEATQQEINKKATWGVFVLAIIGLIIYAFYSALVAIYDWFAGLF